MDKVNMFLTSKKGTYLSTAVASLSMLAATTVFADGEGIVSKIQSMAEEGYGLICDIANPIALIAFALCMCTLFFSRSPQKAEGAYDWCKNIIIGFIVLNVLGLLMGWLISKIGTTDHSVSWTTTMIPFYNIL